MPKILFVHGMNVSLKGPERFSSKWFASLLSGLQELYPGDANLPREQDLELLYWSDLLPPFEEWSQETKGFTDNIEQAARNLMLFADKHVPIDPDHIARWDAAIRKRLEQTVLYMDNVANLQNQVMDAFERCLEGNPRIVIGHSLGSVIAYHGLSRFTHGVDTFITVGSPLATPHLIYERIDDPVWPANVKEWHNFYAPADVWSVPITKLDGKFGKGIQDHEVRHGTFWDPDTHRLDRYLEHQSLLEVIRSAWQRVAQPR